MLLLWIFLGSGLLYLIQRGLYTTLWDRGLKLKLRFGAAAITEGESVTVTERVENRSWLPLPVLNYEYVLSRNFAPVTESGARPIMLRRQLALAGHRAAVNRCAVLGLPRGVYTVIEARLLSSDLFYTCKLEHRETCVNRLTVYPAKLPAEKLEVPFRQLLGAVLTRRMAQEDPFQLKGIRPYEIYDSLRSINWKASAKTGELKVNQYEYSTDEALVFLLDLSEGSEAEREELLRLASSLSQLFLRRGISVSLRSNGRSCVSGAAVRVPSASGIGHQNAVDAALAEIKLSASVTAPFAEFLSGLPASVAARALPVALSVNVTESAAAAFQRAFGAGGGYLLSVGGGASARELGGVRLLSWDPVGEEVVS